MTEREPTEQEIIEAAKLNPSELVFINKISKSAFQRNDRPIVLIAICGSILGNIIRMSEGALTKETIIKLIDIAIQE